MSQKKPLNTRKKIRGHAVAYAVVNDMPYRLSKRWQKHDGEMARNTAGCEPDFARLP